MINNGNFYDSSGNGIIEYKEKRIKLRYYKKQMEESLQSQTQINNKTLSPSTNNLLQTLYIYSSRYLPLMEKDKPQQSANQHISFNNEPLVKQAKQKVLYNYDELNEYVNNLDQKLQQLNKNQLDSLSQKHRYFLRKFKKYLAQQKKLSEIYDALQTTIIQSPPVQEQINSINFIRMVSAQTQQKLSQLRQKFSIAENQKNNNQIKIQQLRKQLNALKSQFFTKKRQQVSLQNQIQSKERNAKQRQLEQKMKRIRIEKRQKDTFIKDIFKKKGSNSQQKLDFSKFTKRFQQDVSFAQIDLVLEQFKSINNNSKQYIRSLQQAKQGFRTRKMQDKKRLNKNQIQETNVENFRIKSRQQRRYRKSEEDELMKNEHIVKKTQTINRLHDEFMTKQPKEILDILNNNNKMKNLLEIIDEVKTKELKQDLIDKRKINFYRSQVYRSNTTQIFKKQNHQDLVNSAIIGL